MVSPCCLSVSLSVYPPSFCYEAMRSPCCLCVCVSPLIFSFLCGTYGIKGKQVISSSEDLLLFLAYFSYFGKIKGGLWDHLAVCMSICLCVCVSPPLQFLKAGIVEPEERAIPILYKHTCDMMPESQNSAVRESPWTRPLLGNGSVIRYSSSWVGLCM
jgi:hypothetical protein